ncbi:hypothetical protein [Peribacillus sp. S4]|uniref:hypothetical protein n=1 Tax=Peribacillus sp. S4 TaxID=3384451 RepID=UPI003989EC34
MERRNFLVNFLLWILVSFFGYTIKKEGENLNLSKTDARMVLDRDGTNISVKIGNINEQLSETLTNNETYIKGNVFDYTSLNDARLRAVNSKSKILNLGSNRTFSIGANTLDFSGLIVKGNNVILQGGGKTVVNVLGSIGNYLPLTADVNRGDQTVSSTLAPSLSPGDLVKIISDGIFSQAEPDRKQGEMHIVQSVTGKQIKFSDLMFDSYTLANNARIAKVNPTTFSISNGVKIKNTATSVDEDRGMSITYAYRPNVQCSFERCGYGGLFLNDCYAPVADVVVNDASHTESPSAFTSYGVSVNNATMYSQIKGTLNYCRHCIAHGGTELGGVAWESTVEVKASGNTDITGNAVLDAHGSTGSVYFFNCKIDNSLIGIKANARYNYIKNCSGRASIAGAEFVVVSKSPGASVDTLAVDGLYLEGYEWAVETNQPVKNLSIKNIKSKWGVSIRSNVTNWNFSDIDVQEWGVAVYASATNVPDTLEVTDIKATGIDPLSSAIYMIYVESPAVKNMILVNCRQKDVSCLARCLNNLDSLQLYNCQSIMPRSAHLYFDSTTITRLVISGGVYRDNQQTGTTHGTVLKGGVITATIQGITTSGTNLIYLIYGKVSTLIHFGNSFHAFAALVTASSPPPLHIIGGSLGSVKIYAGIGSPESVVEGSIGDIYTRTDGGTTTTLYVKTGTGNTGWVAK